MSTQREDRASVDDLDEMMALLGELEPLPPEDDAAWSDDEPWARAERLVELAEIIGERRWAEAVPLALSRMCLGDPGETMRACMGQLECALSDEALESTMLDALRSGPAGARYWAAQELSLGQALGPRPGNAVVVPALLEATHDAEPLVREAAVDSLVSIATYHPEWRDRVRRELGRSPDARRSLAELDEVERAEAIEAEALHAAEQGVPLRMIRTVRRCGRAFRPGCPIAWEALEETAEASVRRCRVCAEPVYFCATTAETLERAAAGACIAREEPSPQDLPQQRFAEAWSKPSILRARHAEARRSKQKEAGIREAIASGVDERRCPDCDWPVPRFRVSCYVCGHELGRG